MPAEFSELVATPDPDVALIWDLKALRTMSAGQTPTTTLWRLEGRIDGRFSMIRVASAVLADGTILGVVALRPVGAAGHGDELIAAAISGDDGITEFSETLLSTEYGPDGTPRRLGLELYGDENGIPIRASGVVGDESGDPDAVVMSFRLDGLDGEAIFERNRLI